MDKATQRWYQRFRDQGVGGAVGYDAQRCLALARAMVWLDEHADEEPRSTDYRDLRLAKHTGVVWLPEDENPADFYEEGEDAPDVKGIREGRYEWLCAVLYVDGDVEASLGAITVESTRDHYCRLVEAELVDEYLARVEDAPPPAAKTELDGVEVLITRGEDGVLVVEIETSEGPDTNEDGTPRMRVWVNEALIHNERGECTPLAWD